MTYTLPLAGSKATCCAPETLGKPVTRVVLDGFTLIESSYSPHKTLAMHAHGKATVSLVRQGSFVEVLRRRPLQCNALDLLVEPAGESHSDQFGPRGATCLHISLSPERAAYMQGISNALGQPSKVQGGLLPTLITRLHRELQTMDSASPLALEGLIFEVLTVAVRLREPRGSAAPIWLRQVKDLMHSQLTSRLNLDSLAQNAGVHAGHLARQFRKHYGTSVGEYLRHLRVLAAIDLIRGRSANLAEIAAAVGFWDQSHLTHAFRKYTGMTPARFAKAVHGGASRTRAAGPYKT